MDRAGRLEWVRLAMTKWWQATSLMEFRSFTWNGRDEWIKAATGLLVDMTIAPIINAWITDNPLCRRRPVVVGRRSRVTSGLVTRCRHVAESSISIPLTPPPPLSCVCRPCTRDFRWIRANNVTWLVDRWIADFLSVWLIIRLIWNDWKLVLKKFEGTILLLERDYY